MTTDRLIATYTAAGPYKPAIRPLSESGNQSCSEMLSKGFDFSALFSSPGLSILRENKEDARIAKEKWLGFTHVPDSEAFDARKDDITRSQLKKPIVAVAPTPGYPCTPARSSVSPYAIGSTTKRRQNLEGLKEIVTYGILKTAKKAGAATVRRQQQRQARVDQFDELESRQKELVHSIGSIEQRYKDLLDRATALPTTTS